MGTKLRTIAASAVLALTIGLGSAPAANAWYWSKCGIGVGGYNVCYKVCSAMEEMKGCVSGWYYRNTWNA